MGVSIYRNLLKTFTLQQVSSRNSVIRCWLLGLLKLYLRELPESLFVNAMIPKYEEVLAPSMPVWVLLLCLFWGYPGNREKDMLALIKLIPQVCRYVFGMNDLSFRMIISFSGIHYTKYSTSWGWSRAMNQRTKWEYRTSQLFSSQPLQSIMTFSITCSITRTSSFSMFFLELHWI